MCTGGLFLCHAGRLRDRRKVVAAQAAALPTGRLPHVLWNEERLRGLDVLAKTASAAIVASSVSPAFAHALAQNDAFGLFSWHGGGGGCGGASTSASAGTSVDAAARSAMPWLQNVTETMGNWGDMGAPSTSFLPSEIGAAMGGGWGQHDLDAREEDILRQVAALNVSLRTENENLRQRLAILSAHVANRGGIVCRHCGARDGNGSGDSICDVDLAKQARAPKPAAAPTVADLEALTQQLQQQMYNQHNLQHDAATFAGMLARVQSSTDNSFFHVGAPANMNSVSGIQEFMAGASQAVFHGGDGTGPPRDQLNALLMQPASLYQSLLSQQRHGDLDANVLAAVAAATGQDTARSHTTRTYHQMKEMYPAEITLQTQASTESLQTQTAAPASFSLQAIQAIKEASASCSTLNVRPWKESNGAANALVPQGSVGAGSTVSTHGDTNNKKRACPEQTVLNEMTADAAAENGGILSAGKRGSIDKGSDQDVGERMDEHDAKCSRKEQTFERPP